MCRAATSLEIVEVEVYGCFILCPYLFLHKTLIIERFYIKLQDKRMKIFKKSVEVLK